MMKDDEIHNVLYMNQRMNDCIIKLIIKNIKQYTATHSFKTPTCPSMTPFFLTLDLDPLGLESPPVLLSKWSAVGVQPSVSEVKRRYTPFFGKGWRGGEAVVFILFYFLKCISFSVFQFQNLSQTNQRL
jgi:hypothetical protein